MWERSHTPKYKQTEQALSASPKGTALGSRHPTPTPQQTLQQQQQEKLAMELLRETPFKLPYPRTESRVRASHYCSAWPHKQRFVSRQLFKNPAKHSPSRDAVRIQDDAGGCDRLLVQARSLVAGARRQLGPGRLARLEHPEEQLQLNQADEARHCTPFSVAPPLMSSRVSNTVRLPERTAAELT